MPLERGSALPKGCKAPEPPALGAPHLDLGLLVLADLDAPVLTVHQTVSDVRGNFYQEKTVFLRCTVSSNPPARFIWKRGSDTLSHSQDNGVDIYEPLYTQVRMGKLAPHTLAPREGAPQKGAEAWRPRLLETGPISAIQGLGGRHLF